MSSRRTGGGQRGRHSTPRRGPATRSPSEERARAARSHRRTPSDVAQSTSTTGPRQSGVHAILNPATTSAAAPSAQALREADPAQTYTGSRTTSSSRPNTPPDERRITGQSAQPTRPLNPSESSFGRAEGRFVSAQASGYSYEGRSFAPSPYDPRQHTEASGSGGQSSRYSGLPPLRDPEQGSRYGGVEPTFSSYPPQGQNAPPGQGNTASTGSYQLVTLATERGPVSIPVDVQAASREADEKRRRNAGASARFRSRRREREQANAREVEDLRDQIRNLEEDVDFYRGERDYLRGLAYETTPERERHFPRPRSPRHRRVRSVQAASFSSASQESLYEEQGERGTAQERYTRRRLSRPVFEGEEEEMDEEEGPYVRPSAPLPQLPPLTGAYVPPGLLQPPWSDAPPRAPQLPYPALPPLQQPQLQSAYSTPQRPEIQRLSLEEQQWQPQQGPPRYGPIQLPPPLPPPQRPMTQEPPAQQAQPRGQERRRPPRGGSLPPPRR